MGYHFLTIALISHIGEREMDGDNSWRSFIVLYNILPGRASVSPFYRVYNCLSSPPYANFQGRRRLSLPSCEYGFKDCVAVNTGKKQISANNKTFLYKLFYSFSSSVSDSH